MGWTGGQTNRQGWRTRPWLLVSSQRGAGSEDERKVEMEEGELSQNLWPGEAASLLPSTAAVTVPVTGHTLLQPCTPTAGLNGIASSGHFHSSSLTHLSNPPVVPLPR